MFVRLRGPHQAALPFRLTLTSVASVEHVYFGGCKPDEETH
jgi:hypothetical protein